MKTLVTPRTHRHSNRNVDLVVSANSEHDRSPTGRPRGDPRVGIRPAGYLRGLPPALLPQGETAIHPGRLFRRNRKAEKA